MGVILTGHIDVPADRLEQITAALPEHIRLSRAEPGCQRFEVVAHPTIPGRFIVSERFTDRAAFEAHQARTLAWDWGRGDAGLPPHVEVEDTSE